MSMEILVCSGSPSLPPNRFVGFRNRLGELGAGLPGNVYTLDIRRSLDKMTEPKEDLTCPRNGRDVFRQNLSSVPITPGHRGQSPAFT
jgi:hypothetical protein